MTGYQIQRLGNRPSRLIRCYDTPDSFTLYYLPIRLINPPLPISLRYIHTSTYFDFDFPTGRWLNWTGYLHHFEERRLGAQSQWRFSVLLPLYPCYAFRTPVAFWHLLFGLYAFAFDIGFDSIVFAFELNFNLDIECQIHLRFRDRAKGNVEMKTAKPLYQVSIQLEQNSSLCLLAYLLAYCAVLFTLLACLCVLLALSYGVGMG